MADSMRHSCKLRTICECLRELADIHQDPKSEHDRNVRKRLFEIERMAKRMTVKLKKYSKKWDKDWWDANPDYEKDLDRRLTTSYIAEF